MEREPNNQHVTAYGDIKEDDMVGYETINTTSYVLPIWGCASVLLIVLLYKFWKAIDEYQLDYDYSVPPYDWEQKKKNKQGPPPPKRIGKTMKCRQYKVENGKLTIFYTDIDTGVNEYTGYYSGGGTAALDALAPPNTKYKYLDCLRCWGYTEEEPSPECLLFGSKKMLDLALVEEIKHNPF